LGILDHLKGNYTARKMIIVMEQEVPRSIDVATQTDADPPKGFFALASRRKLTF
jgi:hypothetical protein